MFRYVRYGEHMATFAYTYTDPLLDHPIDKNIWGVEVERVYEDVGQRQALEQCISFLSCLGTERYLLIRKLDELGDTCHEISDRVQQLERAGVTIIATEQDYHSTQNNAPHLLVQLFREIGDRHTRRKIRQGHQKNRQAHRPPPGRAPYGYKRGKEQYQLDRSTAPIVGAFYEHFLLYGSLREAVRHLDTHFGKKIAVSTGRHWLTNPTYRGHLQYKDGSMVRNTHPAILAENEAAQIDRLLRRNRSLPSRSASAPRCLAGLVKCQQCQQSLVISRVTQRHKSKEYLYLRSPHCPETKKCSAIAYNKIFEATVNAICEDFPKLVSQKQLPPLAIIQANLQQAIAKKEALIEQLPELIEQEIFDQQTAALRKTQLETEIAQLHNKQNQLPPADLEAIAKTITLKQFWYDLSEAERRFYLREFVSQILITPNPKSPWQLELKFIF